MTDEEIADGVINFALFGSAHLWDCLGSPWPDIDTQVARCAALKVLRLRLGDDFMPYVTGLAPCLEAATGRPFYSEDYSLP